MVMEQTNVFTISTQLDAERNIIHILKKNSTVCQCAFRQPTILPHPTLQGQAILNNPICTSSCMFFNLQGNQLNLLCADFTEMVEIEKDKPKNDIIL